MVYDDLNTLVQRFHFRSPLHVLGKAERIDTMVSLLLGFDILIEARS